MPYLALLVLAALSTGYEVTTPEARLVMPYAVTQTSEMKTRTPWGRAHASDYSTSDANGGLFYSFTVFRVPGNKKLEATLLAKTPEYFLANKKCVANIVDQKPLADTGGTLWPQISFKGHCAASSSDYRVLVLIAGSSVYQFHVGYLPRQNNSPEVRDGSLEEALINMIGRFSCCD